LEKCGRNSHILNMLGTKFYLEFRYSDLFGISDLRI
jgi:hypothetical protein